MKSLELDLNLEVETLFRALFDTPPSEKVFELYSQFHVANACRFADSDRSRMALIISKRLDVEALEIFLRHRWPVLSLKMATLVYFAEAIEQHAKIFEPRSRRTAFAILRLMLEVFRSGQKYLKGFFLASYHGFI